MKTILLSVAIVANFVVMLFAGIYVIYPTRYSRQISEISKRYSLDENLVRAVIWVESKYRPNAESSRGAMGLMQLMPDTAMQCMYELGHTDFSKDIIFEPNVNIVLGAHYLGYLSQKFDDVTQVLCAYNCGEGVVFKWLKDDKYSASGKLIFIPYAETKAYVDKVLAVRLLYDRIT